MPHSSADLSAPNNIVIEAGDCRLTILPEFGGKIASLRWKGRELLQTPLLPIQPRTQTMSFDEADASGWDECLPSVSACSVPTAAGLTRIPDHGDLWRVAWKISETKSRSAESPNKESSVTLVGNCFSLPLTLERTI